MTVNTNLPASWSDAEYIEGADTVDKAELIGVPFRITTVYFVPSESRPQPTLWIDAERADGSLLTFTDSSTGVRAQIVKLLTAKEQDGAIDSGEKITLNVVAPNGLRVSEYDVVIPGTNKTRSARTYYLTVRDPRTAQPAAKAAVRKR